MLSNCMKIFWMCVSVRWYILIKYSMSLCQGGGLLILCLFWKKLTEKFRTKNKYFFIKLTWKKLLIRCWGKLFVLLSGERMGQNIWLEGLCLFIKIVKLLSQLMGNYRVHSLWEFVSIKGLLWTHFYLSW